MPTGANSVASRTIAELKPQLAGTDQLHLDASDIQLNGIARPPGFNRCRPRN
jgi:hypothetical protein